jgi:hypothetical protein
MTIDALPYPYRRHLLVAGVLTLAGLSTAVIYEFRSTPFTMVLFLLGGCSLLLAATALFLYAMVRDLRARLGSMTTKRFEPGTVIFRQGDVADTVYVISEGEVETIYEDPAKGEILLRRLGPGEHFGESAILSNTPRQATVRTAGVVEALVIHREEFAQLYRFLPRLRDRIAQENQRRKALAAKIICGELSGPESSGSKAE